MKTALKTNIHLFQLSFWDRFLSCAQQRVSPNLSLSLLFNLLERRQPVRWLAALALRGPSGPLACLLQACAACSPSAAAFCLHAGFLPASPANSRTCSPPFTVTHIGFDPSARQTCHFCQAGLVPVPCRGFITLSLGALQAASVAISNFDAIHMFIVFPGPLWLTLCRQALSACPTLAR